MPSSTSEKHTKHSVRQYLAANISTRHADLPLLACCFVTGIIDAGAYNAWGTFMGMQTGMPPSGGKRRGIIGIFIQPTNAKKSFAKETPSSSP